ncbi:unnamed protein product [Ceutorhynchus assimilis]|uniref:AB hydrolase-1 domain-containing protein n=1 Tax=Ceutorhynchus assimilis TaxID=467358 RepID=A0A9N9MGL2_9CUCU|nr:unnamed protein product [Ceutorhynchus assimilis]
MLLSRNLKLVRCIRKYSSEKLWQEVSIPVPWGEIRGKWWGRTDIRPVLTLHGWQDNCGSFDRLIPLLQAEKLGFLAVDLPGHGYSSRIPPGMSYDSNTYLLTIKYIQTHFGWRKISFLAHSMSGFFAYMYTMYYPDRVDFLALFDSIWHQDDAVRIKAERVESFVKNNAFAFTEKEPPSYSLEQLRQMLSVPNKNSIKLELTDFILKRNIATSALNPGKYYFTRDPRLKSFDLIYCLREEFIKFTQTIICPVFFVRFKQSYGDSMQFYHGVAEILKKFNSRAECLLLDGTHHGHLNTPDELAGLLRRFIDKYGNMETSGVKDGDFFKGDDPRIKELNNNCGVFDPLIPLLNKEVGFLAIDLPGHGYSSRLPPGQYYNLTVYLLTIRYVTNYFQWPKTSILSHSKGSTIAYIYANMFPHLVDFLAILDAIMLPDRVEPMIKPYEKFVQYNEYAFSDNEPPRYTLDEIRQKAHKPHGNSVDLDKADYLMRRDIAPSKTHPGKYYITIDPRTKCYDMLMFSPKELNEYSKYVDLPIFMAKFVEHGYLIEREEFCKVAYGLTKNENLEVHYVKGTHHAMMNNPEELAPLLRNFIRKHNIGDRSIGRMRQEMVVREDPRIQMAI